MEKPEPVVVPSGQGQQRRRWWLVEQFVEAAVELGARAAGAQAAGIERPGRWAEQTQLRAWLEPQVLEEEVLTGEGQWEEDPKEDPVAWPVQGAPVVVPLDVCLEWAVEPQDEPQEWVWELLGGTEGEGETVGAC